MSAGAIVLAAGASRRFGSPKQLATLDGRPLLQHVLDTVTGVDGLEPVVVVLGAHHEEVLAAIDPGRARIALCLGWDEGIAASLRAGLAALLEQEPRVQRAMVVLGDTPLLEAAVVEEVLAAALAAPPAVPVRTIYDGRPGHPVVLPHQLFAAAAELTGDEGARELLADAPVVLVTAGGPGGLDVDTPESLEALR